MLSSVELSSLSNPRPEVLNMHDGGLPRHMFLCLSQWHHFFKGTEQKKMNACLAFDKGYHPSKDPNVSINMGMALLIRLIYFSVPLTCVTIQFFNIPAKDPYLHIYKN